MLVFVMDAPKQEDINKLYSEIYNHISQAKERADEAGKPLLTIVGEKHFNRDGLFAALAAVDVAERLGINKANVEFNQEEMDELTAPKSIFTKLASEKLPMVYVLRDSKEDGFEIKASDPLGTSKSKFEDLAPEKFQQRGDAIENAYREIGEDSIALNGLLHLKHLSESDLSDSYEIAFINSWSASIDDFPKDKDEFPLSYEAFVYGVDSEKVLQVEVKNDVSELSSSGIHHMVVKAGIEHRIKSKEFEPEEITAIENIMQNTAGHAVSQPNVRALDEIVEEFAKQGSQLDDQGLKDKVKQLFDDIQQSSEMDKVTEAAKLPRNAESEISSP